MKKTLAVALTAVLALSAAGCGKETATNTAGEATSAVAEAAQEAASVVAEAAEEAASTAEEVVEEAVTETAAKGEGVMTYEEYAAAELDSEVVVETYVQAKQS